MRVRGCEAGRSTNPNHGPFLNPIHCSHSQPSTLLLRYARPPESSQPGKPDDKILAYRTLLDCRARVRRGTWRGRGATRSPFDPMAPFDLDPGQPGEHFNTKLWRDSNGFE